MKFGLLFLFLQGIGLFSSPVVQAQSVFTGVGTGTIPDALDLGPATYDSALAVTFNVNGLLNNIQAISLSIAFSPEHTYVGDLDVVLSPPAASGLSSFTIFSRVGNPENFGYGFGSDLEGTYGFSDSGGNLWTAANISDVSTIPPGNYRASTDVGTQTSFGSDSTFIGMTPAQANGAWTLTLRDGTNGDTGGVTSASLAVTAVPEPQAYALTVGLGLLGFAIYRRPLRLA